MSSLLSFVYLNEHIYIYSIVICSNDIISKSKQCLQTSCFLFCLFHDDVFETCRVRNTEEPSTDSVVNYFPNTRSGFSSVRAGQRLGFVSVHGG